MNSYISTLPSRQNKNSPWRPTRINPCAYIMQCSKCKNYLPIDKFYPIRSSRSGRKDILNQERNSRCSTCEIEFYIKLDPRKKLLYAAKSHANRKNLECTITIDDIIIPSHCPVLEIPLIPTVGKGRQNRHETYNSPTLDRRDNSQGYIRGNVFVISGRANHLKSNSTIEEMEAVLSYMKSTPEKVKENYYGEYQSDLQYKNRLIWSARRHARERNINCELKVSDLKIPEYCPVLGIKMNPKIGKGRQNRIELGDSPTIDRMNNDIGYISENICVISGRANHLKSDATIEEIESIVSYMKSAAAEVM